MDWIQVNWFFLNLIELIWVKLMNERSNNEIMKKWKNERMKERMNERTNEQTNEWMTDWLTECVNIYMNIYITWNEMAWNGNGTGSRNEMKWHDWVSRWIDERMTEWVGE